MSKKKINKKKKLHILLWIAAALIIAGAAGYTLFIKPMMEQEEIIYKENTAQYGTLQNGVTESGTVEFGIASQVYDLDLTTDDDDDDDDDDEEDEDYLKVEEVYVAVGQRITQGDPVYKFTQSSIDKVRKTLTYARTEAQIALNEAQTQYDVGVLTAGLSYDETMLASSLAEQFYNNTIAKLSNDLAAKTLEIEQLLADIYDIQLSLVDDDYREQRDDLKEAYEDAIEDVEDASEDFVTNRVSAAETFRAARDSYEKFLEQFDESNDEIQDKVDEIYGLQKEILYTQQMMQKDILEASQSYESDTLDGNIAQNTYDSDLTGYESSLQKAKEDLEDAQQLLDDFEEFVGDGTVYAQGSGLVTEVGFDVDDYLENAGVLVAYATSDAMTVSVDVSEEDVVAMKVGDSVTLAFTAYEDETYEGIIQSITTTATSRETATVSYPVVISIQGDTSGLYEGMTADVTFITESTATDLVYVPRKAIVEENGKSYIYKKSGEEYVLSPVETGFTDGENVEIINGLEKDEVYYIAGVALKEDSNGEK